MKNIIYKCKECGKKISEDDLKYAIRDSLISEKLCFECNFWMDKIKTINDPYWLRINNESYYVGDEEDDRLRGFNGQKFRIKFDDGKIIETTNLWHQGTIPERFRNRLPDNAKFI